MEMDEFFDQLGTAEAAEIDKLMQAFEFLSQRFIDGSERQLELLRALKDHEAVVKEQIKVGVMRGAREMLQYGYARITGSRRLLRHD